MSPEAHAEAPGLSPSRIRRVGEIMSWDVHTVDGRVLCRDALREVTARRVHHLPVTEGGVVVGMICVCDLRDASAGETVAERMHAPVVQVNTNATSDDVLALMRTHAVGALTVTYHGFMVGIVSLRDLARAGLLARRPVCGVCGAERHLRATTEGLRCLACRVAKRAG